MYGQLVYTKSMIPQIILAFYMFTSKQLLTVVSYFPVKILYASIISPLSRLYFNVGKFKYFNLFSYLSVLTAITSFVALFCTFSNWFIDYF